MNKILKERWTFNVSAFLFIIALAFCVTATQRSNFLSYFIPYLGAFAGYILLIRNSQRIDTKYYLLILITVFLVTLFQVPHLSNDYYRFLWDGELFWHGINPYDHRPFELYDQGFTQDSNYLVTIYEGIGEMSQKNYSCYPFITQVYFIVSTAFTDSVLWNTVLLKALIICTELLGLLYLLKSLRILGLNQNRAFILLLNPLFILETTANVHFEGVMISFLIIAFYFLVRSQYLIAGVVMALAIQVKLIPLILLPFFWRLLGPKKSLFFYSIILSATFLLSLLQLNGMNIMHFLESLQLYFEVFEFNSFILFYYLNFGEWMYDWNMTRYYAPYLSRIAVKLILIISLYGLIKNNSELFKRMTIAFFCYLLLSSTLHPWYILPALFLSIFTEYIFIHVWTLTIMLSYSFYSTGNSASTNHLVLIEYIPVLLVFIVEMLYGGLLGRMIKPIEKEVLTH